MAATAEVLDLFGGKIESRVAREDRVIAEALAILEERLTRRRVHGDHPCGSPSDAARLCKLFIAASEREKFVALWMDNRHRLLDVQVLFEGTIDGSAVHPREVVKAALSINASAVIFAHNHPSGVCEPSSADRNITRQLKEALDLVGVSVLDHLVVGEGEPASFAKRGWI